MSAIQPLTPDVKFMNLQEFVDFGLLQEVNRQWAHPRGLAFAVACDENMQPLYLLVQDRRTDSEGVIYDSSTLDVDKACRVRDDYVARGLIRIRALGFVVQPIEGETNEK